MDVKRALNEASLAARNAAEEHHEKNTATDGIDYDVCGSAYVVTEDGQSPVIQAMLELKEARVLGNVYYISDFTEGVRSQALSNHEAAAKAAVRVLEKAFPEIGFRVRTVWG